MKKLFLVCLFSSLIFFSYSQVLFTYGSHSVTAAEFLKAFNKNKTDSSNDSAAMQNYLDLYINFKLKVQAAKDMRLDTLASMKADVQNFRSQIQGNYLTDQKEIQNLTDEAFKRSQKDIHTVYYLIKPAENADSSKFVSEIKRLAKELKTNKGADILSQIKSNNLFKTETGDLGYITVFTLPYAFENIIYGLKPGQESVPYAGKNGWYIFKNIGERKAVGKITVAQILFAIPEGVTNQRKEIKKLADSVYDALKKGSDFATLTKEFSDDKSTFLNGGLVPEFGTAKYDSTFENHAFSLKENGAISPPFATKFGYHIVKRISANPVPIEKNDETFMYNLKQEVLKDSRSEIAQQKFVAKILPLIGYKKTSVNEQNLWNVTDSLLKNKDFVSPKINAQTVLFTFNNGSKVKVSDWISYLKNKSSGEEITDKKYEKIFQHFSDAFAIANYASRLENFDPAFKAQLDEFKEGNLLFQVMQQKVWDKAAEDSAGLKTFYEQHKEKYLWNRSADAIIFSCSSLAVANNTILQLRKGQPWRQIVNENSSEIQADSGRFDLGQIPVVDRTNFTDGLITLPVVNKNDGTAVFAKILKIYPANEPRKFEDARGLVITDYQNYIEQKWITQLKKKYPVKVNESVFQSLINKTKR